MNPPKGSGGGRRRWSREVRELLVDFPHQHAALEYSMAAFGQDFDLATFKRAFEDRRDLARYSQVQALERGVSRVQSYVAEMAIAGSRLAALESRKTDAGPAERAFAALAAAGVIDRHLAAGLTDAQRSRNRIEHFYIRLSAGEVHTAALLVRRTSREFVAAYAPWVGEWMEES